MASRTETLQTSKSEILEIRRLYETLQIKLEAQLSRVRTVTSVLNPHRS